MKASIIAVLLLASATLLLNVEASLAQELSAEDRACVNAAIDRLPLVDALRVEGSRVLMSQPGHQGRVNSTRTTPWWKSTSAWPEPSQPTVFSATAIPYR